MERHLADALTRICADAHRLSGETKELASFVAKHFFNKVPSASAVSGILAGAIVSSNFTATPVKSAMAVFGVVSAGNEGGITSPLSYSLLSVFVPVLTGAATIYIVQKALKSYRKKRLLGYMEASSRLEKDKLAELASKRSLLEEARDKGLLTDGEYETKLAGIYRARACGHASGVQEFIVKKLTS